MRTTGGWTGAEVHTYTKQAYLVRMDLRMVNIVKRPSTSSWFTVCELLHGIASAACLALKCASHLTTSRRTIEGRCTIDGKNAARSRSSGLLQAVYQYRHVRDGVLRNILRSAACRKPSYTDYPISDNWCSKLQPFQYLCACQGSKVFVPR